MSRLARWVVRAQGLYYILTGAWPLVSLRTFYLVTGPKVDDWLVQTVGVLATVIGIALLVGARRERPSVETIVLACGAAAGFALVDVVFVARDRIPPIYLADAVVELLILAGVLAGWLAARRAR